MHRHRRFTLLPVLALLLTLLFLTAGCTPRLGGKYRDADGMMTIAFTSGSTAEIITPVGTLKTEYRVSGDTVTLQYQGEDLVLTRKPDGSLEGPAGTYTKL